MKERIRNIDFLRIVGCLVIIIFHLAGHLNTDPYKDISIYNSFYQMSREGHFAVDLFFIISGFFFACKLNIKQSVFQFIRHKLIRLYPVLIFLIVLSFLISLTGIIKWHYYSNLLGIFGVLGTGLAYKIKQFHAGQFWYCTSMLYAMLFIFGLRKNFEKQKVNFFIGVLIFLTYSFIIQAKSGNINGIGDTFFYVFNMGMLRAIGGVGIGYLIGDWYKDNKEKVEAFKVNIKSYFFISMVEFMCVFFIINDLMLHRVRTRDTLIFIYVFALCVFLFVCKKGFISKILDKQIYTNLAKYTYAIFMGHLIVFRIYGNTVLKYCPNWVHTYPIINFALIILISILFGVLIYHFVERPACLYLKKFEGDKTYE